MKHSKPIKSLVLLSYLFLFGAGIFLAACESPSGHAFLSVIRTQCTGCGECEKVCATDAIQIINGKAIIDPAECTECGKCVQQCPEDAIY